MDGRVEKISFSQYINSISSNLVRPVDSSTLGAFRIIFGCLMVWSTLKYFNMGWIQTDLIAPKIHFPYELFPWVTPWPGDGMYYHFAFMALSALFIAIGLFFRISAILFFFTYTHFFLIDKTYFNNHYYFICLLGFIFCFTNAHHWMSLDNLWQKKQKSAPTIKTVPYWNVLLIKAQIFIVYFFGGIAKLNLDWLKGEPMRHWLEKTAIKDSIPELISNFLKSEFAAYFFSYGGLIFDLAIGFLLINKKTRLLAIFFLLIFNITNSFLFSIGVFPFLMIGATIIFFEPETPRKLFLKLFSRSYTNTIYESQKPRFQKSAMIFVSIFLAIQVLVPFRHFLYEGYAGWTEEGRLFAWRMKLSSKSKCHLKIQVTRPDTGQTWPIVLKEHVTFRQYARMCRSPQMVYQFANILGAKLIKEGIENPVINANTSISFNFRPPQPIIDPATNLMAVDNSIFQHAHWILPLKH
ncbi:MAG: HTTM domain-containing protein [Nitrospinales bacterium]